ncbi:hypothetical protein EV182_007935, partial [Spiromyces aspiralis]
PVFLKTSGKKDCKGVHHCREVPPDVEPDSAESECADRLKPGNLSFKEAVRFAIENNLLGIICEASLLINVPHLIVNIKSSGLLLASYGSENISTHNQQHQRKYGVDATEVDGVLHYNPIDQPLDFAI